MHRKQVLCILTFLYTLKALTYVSTQVNEGLRVNNYSQCGNLIDIKDHKKGFKTLRN